MKFYKVYWTLLLVLVLQCLLHVKKPPPTALKKKTTVSARAKVDVAKISKKKQHLNINDGPYLGESPTVGGGHVTLQGNVRTSVPQSHDSQANQQILTLLQDL